MNMKPMNSLTGVLLATGAMVMTAGAWEMTLKSSGIFVAMMTAPGAKAMPLHHGDAYSPIQTGVIHGAVLNVDGGWLAR
jgi:hypothetical protein